MWSFPVGRIPLSTRLRSENDEGMKNQGLYSTKGGNSREKQAFRTAPDDSHSNIVYTNRLLNAVAAGRASRGVDQERAMESRTLRERKRQANSVDDCGTGLCCGGPKKFQGNVSTTVQVEVYLNFRI